jgi:hypothetical protein
MLVCIQDDMIGASTFGTRGQYINKKYGKRIIRKKGDNLCLKLTFHFTCTSYGVQYLGCIGLIMLYTSI